MSLEMEAGAQIDDIELLIEQTRFTGLRRRAQRRPDAPRLLCLHGWLDNAASFVPLMPLLPDADIVALDFPGHGHSAWISSYTMFELACFARHAMRALEWDTCHVLGHSMGGCVAPQLAVAAPQAITSLTLIEASGPLSEEADQLPARLQRALADRLDAGRFNSRTFKVPDEAVAARLKAARMTSEAAALIIERQLVEQGGGWQWRFDPKLRTASPQYQTEAQVRSVLAAITCPTLTIVADDGFLAPREDTAARLSCLTQRTAVTLPGNHHLHMETPADTAEVIRSFLNALQMEDTCREDDRQWVGEPGRY